MSENRFADCPNIGEVLWKYHELAREGYDSTALNAPAVARIRELAPPPTVSEEARERARKVLTRWAYDGFDANFDRVMDWIIDALGYTPAPPKLICTCGEFETIVCEKHPAPASPPVVDLAPDELRWLAAVVEDYEKLYNDASRVVDDDTLPPMFYLHLRDSRQSVRVVCGENCWVLRIGGDQ